MKFYYTRDKNDNPRHVVVSDSEPSDGKVQVTRVGLHPSVSGTARRGKRPTFAEPVSVDELTEMSADEVTEELRTVAERLFAAPASSDDLN